MARYQADNPGAGIFRPVYDTLQNDVDSNSLPKTMTRVVWGRTDSPPGVMSDIHCMRCAALGQKGRNS